MTDFQREELVERLVEALKPFAEAYAFWNGAEGGVHDDNEIDDQGMIKIGDCRRAAEALSALQVVGNEEAGVSQSQPCGDGGRAAPTEAEPSAAFNLRDLAEVATKAIYTHGFGFREVIGPSHHGHSEYVNFCWDDDTIVRAVFSLHPDETPDALAKAGTARSPQPIREDQSIDRRSDTLSVGLDAGGSDPLGPIETARRWRKVLDLLDPSKTLAYAVAMAGFREDMDAAIARWETGLEGTA